jgi:transcription elongation GreA/GreB family factor
MASRGSSRDARGVAVDGEVEIGERVTVLDLTTGAVRDYRIAPRTGEVPPESPLGAALLGRHVGDVVEVYGVRLEVVEIDG